MIALNKYIENNINKGTLSEYLLNFNCWNDQGRDYIEYFRQHIDNNIANCMDADKFLCVAKPLKMNDYTLNTFKNDFKFLSEYYSNGIENFEWYFGYADYEYISLTIKNVVDRSIQRTFYTCISSNDLKSLYASSEGLYEACLRDFPYTAHVNILGKLLYNATCADILTLDKARKIAYHIVDSTYHPIWHTYYTSLPQLQHFIIDAHPYSNRDELDSKLYRYRSIDYEERRNARFKMLSEQYGR